jgi:WD40 repeat protein
MGFSQEKVRKFWLWSNGSCLAVLENHFSVVRGLDFSVDGETMVSAGRDQVVNFWDMKTFKLKSSLPVYEVHEPNFCGTYGRNWRQWDTSLDRRVNIFIPVDSVVWCGFGIPQPKKRLHRVQGCILKAKKLEPFRT